MPVPLIDNPAVAELFEVPACMRPPQWRYIITQHALANPSADIEAIKKLDLLVYDACRAKRAVKFHTLGLPEVSPGAKLDPTRKLKIINCFRYFEQGGIRSRRFILEAMLLTGATRQAIGQRAHLPVEFIDLFHDLFYDVAEFQGDKPAIYAYVLPASFSRARMGAVWDICWKIYALDNGIEGLSRAMTGEVTQSELRRMFQRQQTRLMEMADCMLHAGPANLAERELAVLAAARSHWDLSLDSRMAESNAHTLAMESFFNELAVMVSESLANAKPLPGKTSSWLPGKREQLLLANG